MDSLRERCTRCGMGRPRPWQELTEEEREVVKRLPASADYTPAERHTRHRWCTHCWHETTATEDRA